MTDRERELIKAYLPNPRDPDLPPDDYYVLDNTDRVQRVHIRNIAYDKESYGVYQVFTDSGRLVHGPYESSEHYEIFGGGWYHMGALYDNKQDCKDCVHSWYHSWEDLRQKQKEECL